MGPSVRITGVRAERNDDLKVLIKTNLYRTLIVAELAVSQLGSSALIVSRHLREIGKVYSSKSGLVKRSARIQGASDTKFFWSFLQGPLYWAIFGSLMARGHRMCTR